MNQWMSHSIKKWMKHPFIMHLSIWLAMVLVYASGINAPFIWDDEVMVLANPLIRSLEHIPSLFTVSAFGEQASATDFYRPFQVLTYIIDYKIWGFNPVGFRLTSLALMGVASSCLMMAIQKMGYSMLTGWVIGLSMAIHPIGIEGVTYISGRGDILYVALCMFIWYRLTVSKSYWPLWWMLPLYTAAIFTKENAIPFSIGLCVLTWVNPTQLFKPHHRWMALGLSGISILVTVVRLVMMGGKTPTLSWIASASLLERIMTLPYILSTYTRLIAIPTHLHMEYHWVSTGPDWYWLAAGIVAVLLTLMVMISTNRQASLAWLAWGLLMLGPVLHSVPLASTVREHWAMLSQIGVWMMVVHLPIWGYRWAKWVVVIWLVGWGISTSIRNLDWTDPLRLYAHDVALEPRSFVLHNNLGVTRSRLGLHQLGCQSFLDSINSTPSRYGYGTALNNWGVCQEQGGNLDEAIGYYIQSIQSSRYELAYANLARVLIRKGEANQAIDMLKNGLDLYPYNTELWFWLGVAYHQGSEVGLAWQTFNRLKQIDPSSDARIKAYLDVKE